jgi:hypothetical protein
MPKNLRDKLKSVMSKNHLKPDSSMRHHSNKTELLVNTSHIELPKIKGAEPVPINEQAL